MLAAALGVLIMSLAATTTAPSVAPAGFLYKTLELDGATYAYSVFVPPDYTPARKWPVVLFLHGSGERGADGLLSTEVGIGSAIRRDFRRVPAIVVFPQCRAGQAWVVSPQDIGPMGRLALASLDAAMRDYSTDPERVYLTGLSLGGQGAWWLAINDPRRWAAVVPVCGFLEDKDRPSQMLALLTEHLRDVPVWVVHGEKDPVVPVERSREAVAALRAAGAPVRYVELPGVGHNAWDKGYADAALWTWLFEQRRAPATRPAEP
ncbi:MAG: prolyl oligopeptidase family serine peptidase [Phycisphaerales bacterium]|nr:prolyl oligopeptidase family serine peptidase [Phycisphaerales bacterium]